jgi:riboflavin biosynthesis pyrimidine reductase
MANAHAGPVPSNFAPLGPLPEPWEAASAAAPGRSIDLVVVGQIGSRSTAASRRSPDIPNTSTARRAAHLHRLRALVDAVLVGIGTAVADDPQLTVRRVAGPSPARIVLDPRGAAARCQVLTEDGVRRLSITAEGCGRAPGGVEIVEVPAAAGIAPAAILAALAERGFGRILIEGGAHTVSRFIAAGCLDRLHVMVAPTMLGSGQAGITLNRSSPPTRRCARRCGRT